MSLLFKHFNKAGKNINIINDIVIKNSTSQATNGIFLILAVLAFFIQPFYILIFVTILQLYINFKSVYFLPIFCAALALYWSNRHIGISWNGGVDDAIGYIESFVNMKKDDIIIIFLNFINQPAGNEIGYSLFVYLIRFFTSNENIFLFFVYFTMLSLLSLAALKINGRYNLLIISVIFFGVGGFVEQAALHLFRATLASLVLFYAVSFFQYNKKKTYILMFLSCIIHVAAIPLVLIYFIIKKIRSNEKLSVLFLYCFLFVLFFRFIISFIDLKLIDATRALYLNADSNGTYSEQILLGIILFISYKCFNKANPLLFRYSYAITAILFFIYVLLPEYTFIAGRYLYLIQLFTGILMFHIIMKIRVKSIICTLLLVLFIRKMNVLNNSEFIIASFDKFLNIFSPIHNFF